MRVHLYFQTPGGCERKMKLNWKSILEIKIKLKINLALEINLYLNSNKDLSKDNFTHNLNIHQDETG